MALILLKISVLATFGLSYGQLTTQNRNKDQVCSVTENSILAEQIQILQRQISVIKEHYVHRDCSTYRSFGNSKNGLYQIETCCKAIDVYCDMQTDGGGWLVFQRRMNGAQNFYQNWESYKVGFGDKLAEFWLGNDNIAQITAYGKYELRVDLEDFDGVKVYALYSEFSINKEEKYKLKLGAYEGSAGNSLDQHNGHMWSTYDSDNDANANNCAEFYKGAWWYVACHSSNLNGLYHRGNHSSYADGVNWYTFRGHHYSLKFTEMKIRPAGYTPK